MGGGIRPLFADQELDADGRAAVAGSKVELSFASLDVAARVSACLTSM